MNDFGFIGMTLSNLSFNSFIEFCKNDLATSGAGAFKADVATGGLAGGVVLTPEVEDCVGLLGVTEVLDPSFGFVDGEPVLLALTALREGDEDDAADFSELRGLLADVV